MPMWMEYVSNVTDSYSTRLLFIGQYSWFVIEK